MSSATKSNTTARPIVPFLYSLVCYAASLFSLIYFIVFASGVYAPISVNSQSLEQPLLTALVFNIALIALFGLQHSIMARKRFKQWLFNYLPESAERATFCLGTAIALVIMVYFWQPMNGQVWQVTGSLTGYAVQAIGAAGWLILLIASFQLDHFELFGLRQTFTPLLGRPMPSSQFRTPGLYKIVRHPIQLGVLLGVWFVPESTANHLLLAIGMTLYIFIGLYFEEKALIQEFGNNYRDYKQRVAKLIPFIG
ncbi:isoprenylcysteine carboxylmethyltransferase family protein [Aliiglaciecola litoralis]|uniref:Isoprenylcysteine carboxylmethyltransferase family protein n=1 Tax=Aliiglaciecola litoralis TaxID=582857 RepID=A0ABN1LQG2_9ALTE